MKMPSPERKPTLVAIVGPTAVGKTRLALQLAESLNGEIISADSRLFYRGLDIGTDKPSRRDRTRVRHHLIDTANPDETISLATFQSAVDQAIKDIRTRGRVPFLVGGTGQYIRAIVEGWLPPKIIPRPDLRRAIELWATEIGAERLHDGLRQLDPLAAGRIGVGNVRRSVRALEVIFSSGRRFSEQQHSGISLYHVLQIGLSLPRDQLYARIDRRIELMFHQGFIDEVQQLLDQGYSPELSSLSAIGYREVIEYLQGDISLDDAIVQMKRRTRAFVRRQANWFKSDDPAIHWFDLSVTSLYPIENFIRDWLKENR